MTEDTIEAKSWDNFKAEGRVIISPTIYTPVPPRLIKAEEKRQRRRERNLRKAKPHDAA